MYHFSILSYSQGNFHYIQVFVIAYLYKKLHKCISKITVTTDNGYNFAAHMIVLISKGLAKELFSLLKDTFL